MLDAPAGSHVDATLHTDPVVDRTTFNQTLFFNDLGDDQVHLEDKPVDDMTGTDGRRRAAIDISLKQDLSHGQLHISLTKGLHEPGAYPLDIKLIGPDDTVLDRMITYLIKLPNDMDPIKPLRAAMFFDVHAPPSVGPKGISRLSSKDLDRIAAVAVALQPHPDAKVTLVPTPETIEALARTEGRPQELLELLQDAPSRTQVVDGPYVDVPVSSWIAAGMQDELNKQRQRGNAVLTEHLGATDRTTWVASPELTTEAAAELWEGGVTRFVLPESSFGALPDDPDAPTPARPFQLATRVAAPVQAVANDSSLAYALGRDNIDDPELQAQQLVAQLSVIQGEAPDQARGVVFGLEPGKPVSSRVVDETLSLIASNPLVRTATVAEVFSDVEPARNAADGSVVQRELTPAPSADLGDYPTRLREVQARIASFSSMVTRSDDLLASWQQRLLESGAADLSPDQRNEYIDTIHTTIDRRTAAIQSPPKQSVTLTSNEGVIPFTIRNLLRQRVSVSLELQGTSRLEFPGGESRKVINVAPGTNQLRLKVRTRSPGVSPVIVQVTSPDGGLLVTSSRVTVRSTAVSGIGYVLSVGAGLFLIIWWFRHWRRARREHHQVTALPAAGS